MLTVVTWLWPGVGPRRFEPAHVEATASNIRRHLRLPHRFVCIADDPSGFPSHSACEVIETPPGARRVAHIVSPEGTRFPACYRRLWLFSAEAEAIGSRFLAIDIDLVATGDLARIAAAPGDFVGWRPRAGWGNRDRYGGGLYLLDAGARRQVWDRFEGAPSILAARAAGFRGSDQAWISYVLGPAERVWPSDVGIYSIRDLANGRRPLPADARLVQFNGPVKPWGSPLAWVREHWQ